MQFRQNLKIIIMLLVVLIAAKSLELNAQVKGLSSGSEKEDMFNQSKSNIDINSLTEQDKMPVGNTVDPKYYYLGPGDVVSLQVLPMLPYENPMMVSPDMTLLLPRGGEINVKGLTLAQLKDSLQVIFAMRNADNQVLLTLKKSRLCIVTINGNVLFPGTYSLPSSYRVSTAIKFANQITSEKVLSEDDRLSVQKMLATSREKSKNFSESGVSVENLYAQRNTILLRQSSGSQTVDAEKANSTSNFSYDPFIKEGDEIFVPFEPYQYAKISVSGAVQRPAVVPFKTGDMLSDLVKFGYGFTDKADLSNIRLFQSGKSPELVKVDSNMNLLSNDFEILAGSALIVGQADPLDYNNLSVVSVRGQVSSPGIYPIVAGQTRLRDVVDFAGGFTKNAYLPLAYIIRRQEQADAFFDYKRNYFATFQYSDLVLEDTSRFAIDMMLKKPIVSCNFVKAFAENSDIDNVILRDGDVIMVPDNPRQVYVYGQVNHPGFVEFHDNQNMNWYIEKAGGYAQGAAEDRARIIRGKSNVWTEGDNKIAVLAGDEVYVPRPPDIPQTLLWQKYGTIAALVSVGFAVINTIFNMYLQNKYSNR